MKPSKTYTIEAITDEFMHGVDCSQVVVSAFSDRFGMDPIMFRKLSAAFGGGMLEGKTCGAVIGAFLLLGLQYGHSDRDESDEKVQMYKAMIEFRNKFKEEFGSEECHELLGGHLSDLEESKKIMEENRMMTLCPEIVEQTISILEEML